MSSRKKTILAGADWGVTWAPPGPVAAAFHASDAPARVINGPVGSGKTGSGLIENLFRAIRQSPNPRDGVRRTKGRVVRNTMANLEKTTIPSWWQWMPPTVGKWTQDPWPAHEVELTLQGIGRVQLVLEFVALGEHRVEDVMRGWEGTWVYLDEVDTLPPGVLQWCLGRVLQKRYPPMRDGGPSWTGVWASMNAPDEDSWAYQDLFGGEPRGVGRHELANGLELFVQPGGRDPEAENLANLGPGSYDELAKIQPDWWVRRFIDNKPGYSQQGKPVYALSYSDRVHVSEQALTLDPSVPLQIGGDAGRHPAAAIGQAMPSGQLRLLGELEHDNASARLFGEMLNAYLARRFPELAALRLRGFRILGWGDPSAGYGTETDESTWLEIMSAVCKFPWAPAPVPDNSITLRLSAVANRLEAPGPADRKGLLLDAQHCRMLRRGFVSAYRFKRVAGVTGNYRDTPDKDNHPYPDLHDALQYLALGACGISGVLGRQAAFPGGGQQQRAIDEEHGAGDPTVWQHGRPMTGVALADGRFVRAAGPAMRWPAAATEE